MSHRRTACRLSTGGGSLSDRHLKRRLAFVLLVACWLPAVLRPASGGEPPAELLVTRIALGSCVKQDRPMPIWSAVRDFQPDVLLMLGDNIYGDTEDMAELRAKYGRLAADPGFAAVRAAVPIVAVWDDHDYGVNDGGREYPRRRESQQVFCDFFGIPADAAVRTQDGTHRSLVLGPPGRRVQFICLDTRFHRSPLESRPMLERVKGKGPYVPSADPEATVLGAAQWAWLAATLREPAELRIVLSSIQLASIEHGWEHWGNFPAERARLLATLRESGAEGVIIVSGDRHSAEISMIPADDNALAYPLFDLTASSFNQPKRVDRDDEPNRYRLGTRFHGANFGSIEIDWASAADGGSPAVRLAIHDVDGKVVRSAEIPAGELAHAP
jgi:alkaline phosphatase D